MERLAKVRKALLWTLGGVSITLIVSPILPWEYREEDIRDDISFVLLLSIPSIILILSLLDYVLNRKSRMLLINLILGAFLAGSSLIFMGILSFSNFDSRGIEKTILQHRFKSKHRVISRSHHYSKETKTLISKPLTPWHQLTIPIDTTEINPYLWIKTTDTHN